MRTPFVIALLAAALLAGCAEPATPIEEDEDFSDLDLRADAQTGVIRGVVIDSAIVPIEDVTIELLNQGKSTTTNADGLFGFERLEPGTYFLKASKPGFTEVQSSVDVVAGIDEPPVTKIVIDQVPGTEPRVQTYEDVGYIGCSWGVPITYGYCGDDLGDPDDPHLEYFLDGSPDWIQIEITWDSTQAAGDNLYMIQAVCPPDDYDICPGSTPFEGDAPYRWDEGTYQSPAIMRSPAGYMQEAREYHGLETMDGWTVGVDVSADGPALATGVTLQQEFSGYVTVFWNVDPIEDWSFVNDGAYPL